MAKATASNASPEDWRTVQVTWQEGMAFEGQNAAGNTAQISGKAGEGVAPMELLLLGVAGCTAVDVVNILEKKRKKLDRFQVQVRGKRRAEHPRIYTEIQVHYELWGSNLDEDSVLQAIHLSEEKYCSASAMLSAVAQIESTYQIHDSQTGSDSDPKFISNNI